jgi:hypothetical protein
MLFLVNDQNLDLANSKIAEISVSFERIPVTKLKCFDILTLKPKKETIL